MQKTKRLKVMSLESCVSGTVFAEKNANMIHLLFCSSLPKDNLVDRWIK